MAGTLFYVAPSVSAQVFLYKTYDYFRAIFCAPCIAGVPYFNMTEQFRFGHTVLLNNEVQLKEKLDSIINLPGVTIVIIDVTGSIKGKVKPAYMGDLVFL